MRLRYKVLHKEGYNLKRAIIYSGVQNRMDGSDRTDEEKSYHRLAGPFFTTDTCYTSAVYSTTKCLVNGKACCVDSLPFP